MVRLLAFVVMTALFSTSSAFADFEGKLLSYNEIMELSKAKRMAYLDDLRELIVLMEKHEAKFEGAEDTAGIKVMRGQVAMMMQMMSLVPQASAQAATDKDLLSSPTTPAVPAPPAKVKGKTPPAKAATTTPPAKTATTTPAKAKPGEKIPLPPRRPKGMDKPAVDTAANCSVTPFDCTHVDPKERTSLEAKFRSDHSDGANVCISGGFFSQYDDAGKSRGNCHIVREFPPGSKTPAKSCPKSQAMCNPWAFCVAGDVGTKEQPDLVPAFHCEDAGGKAKWNITERCDQWYQAQIKESSLPNHKGVPTKACDPGDIKSAPIKEAWDELANSMKAKYQRWCSQDQGFASLFCTECKVVQEHIVAMNTKAVGSPCPTGKPEAAGPPAPETTTGAKPEGPTMR